MKRLMRMAAIGGLLGACVSEGVLAAGQAVRGPFSEPALVFLKADLDDGQLPNRILLAPVPATFRSQLKFSCLGVEAAREEILIFLAHSGRCLPLGGMRSSVAKTSLIDDPVSRESAVREIGKQLENQSVVLVLPKLAEMQTAAVCYCPPDPGNARPSVHVSSGSPQTVVTGNAIGTITFSASDSDSLTLHESFTYSLDGSAWQADLPAGLSPLCGYGAGTLSCSVTGLAPAVTGEYRIRLGVSDGSRTGYATAYLTVEPAGPFEIIFEDGFESSP